MTTKIVIVLICASGLAMARPRPAATSTAGATWIDPAGRFSLTMAGEQGSYYRLLRSTTLGGASRCVAMGLGDGGSLVLSDALGITRQGFYRIERVPSSAPLDTDADGENDLSELLGRPNLNPLNAARPIAFEDGALLIPDWATFDALAHRDNFPGAVGVREIKFLVSGADTPKPQLYLVNTKTRIYHYDFARAVLGYAPPPIDYWTGLTQFNNETYFTNVRRKFIAGSLILYPSYQAPGRPPGTYAVEFWPTDPVSEPFVRMAMELVGAATPFIGNGLAYHPSGETQRALLKTEKSAYATSPVPIISSEALFSQVTYTMLNPGVTFGRLLRVSGAEVLSLRDIPIFHTLPNTLTRVAGIISSTPQTPLAHINLKAQQNSSPNCYVRDAETNPQIVPLLGKYVRMEVAPDGLLLREATGAEVDAHFEALRPADGQSPPRDLTQITIQPTGTLRFANSTAFGPKAANVAEMARWLEAWMVPTGHAVPFYFYDEFMKANHLYDSARLMVADPSFQSDPVRRDKVLKEFRKLIKDGQVPGWMIPALSAVTEAHPIGTSLRCRSSTNNEDLPGFNGAGLYDSYTHRPSDDGHLVNTVKQVWASLWNYRAFEEREFNRIDHFSAAMGVLIYPNFDDEKANGVAVSKNIFDPDWTGYYVNAQLGEALVTNPEPDAVPEEFLIASLYGAERYEIQYSRFSSLAPEATTVLTKAQAFQLADTLAIIQSRFRSLYGKSGDPGFAMEIEFKITFGDKLIVKQARPWVE